MTDSQRLVRRMVTTFPVLEGLLEEHLQDMEGELLPYLLLADVARWANEAVGFDAERVTELVDWLEAEFVSSQPPERDLIGLGFVEAIPSTPYGDPVLRLLGPAMHEVAAELGLLIGDN